MAITVYIHVFGFIIGYLSYTGSAMRCFQCESSVKNACADTFTTNSINTEVVPCLGSCAKYIEISSRGEKLYSRFCIDRKMPDQCIVENGMTSIHTECYCNSDICNGAMGMTAITLMIVTIALICCYMSVEK
ncbi:hypothetical protein CHS0354_021736 [Potamilus streckersoni]|uniref:Protein quiver n=1 Tax=Potamilus streckersoni TaxID=2493646 RepID=A0AAE0TKB2_9BIVA|nr:hypothetical protein CHS0354_021736 [Potamilus streckersoni]